MTENTNSFEADDAINTIKWIKKVIGNDASTEQALQNIKQKINDHDRRVISIGNGKKNANIDYLDYVSFIDSMAAIYEHIEVFLEHFSYLADDIEKVEIDDYVLGKIISFNSVKSMLENEMSIFEKEIQNGNDLAMEKINL